MSPAVTTMTAWSAHPSGIILTGPSARPTQPQAQQAQPQHQQQSQSQGRKQEKQEKTTTTTTTAASTATATKPHSLLASSPATLPAPSELPTPTQSPPATPTTTLTPPTTVAPPTPVAPTTPEVPAPAAENPAGILYDYIIFYRWLSPDGAYERGRVMARLVAEVMEKTAATRHLLSQANPTTTNTTVTNSTTTATNTSSIIPPPPPPPSPPAAATRPGRHSIWLDQREILRSAPPRDVVGKIARTFRLVDQVIILAAPGDWARFANDDDIHRWEWELSLRSDKKVWVLQYGLPEQEKALSGEQLAAGLGAYNPRLADLARTKKVNVRVITMDNLDVVLREIAEAS